MSSGLSSCRTRSPPRPPLAALEAAGVADRVEAQQPKRPPKFDTQLVGKRLEVCWPYKKEGKTVKIWASGTVKRIADGLAAAGGLTLRAGRHSTQPVARGRRRRRRRLAEGERA